MYAAFMSLYATNMCSTLGFFTATTIGFSAEELSTYISIKAFTADSDNLRYMSGGSLQPPLYTSFAPEQMYAHPFDLKLYYC